MVKYDLLARASSDIQVAEIIIQEFSDQIYTDQAAYHTQQAIEKTFKYHLSMGTKEPFPRVHDFEILCEFAEKHSVSYPEWIKKNAVLLTEFESGTRYGTDLIAARSTVMRFIELSKQYLMESGKEEK